MNSIGTYLLNCSFHGLPFVADSRYHWSERLFWIISVIFSWCASILMMLSSYNQFKYSAISFTVDTSYLDWKSNFPAIIFCERGNSEYVKYADEWFDKPRDYDADDVLRDIAFFNGALGGFSRQCVEDPAGGTIVRECPAAGGNFTMFANTIRSRCEDLLKYCSWNNQVFDCCSIMLPVNTIFGECYGINSLTNSSTSVQKISMMVSHKYNSGGGKFTVELQNADMKIFVLSLEEVPLYTQVSNLAFDGISSTTHEQEETSIYLAIEEMHNEEEVKSTSIERRHCRFPNENYLITSKVYSYSACIVDCLRQMHLDMCNCTHHLMPAAKQHEMCDIEGLICLSLNFAKMNENTGKCDCESSCTEMEVSIIGSISKRNVTDFHSEDSITRLNFILHPPTLRYIRKVVNGNLDLIVSMGGTAGLCVGASLLTAVEIIYYFFIRPLSDAKRQKPMGRKNIVLEKQRKTFINKQKKVSFKKNLPLFPFVN